MNVNGFLDFVFMMNVIMFCDYRVIDGVVGVKYLVVFKDLIENFVSLVM